MDKSKRYMDMAELAFELQLKKYEEGFNEGDFVFDGKDVHVIGQSFGILANWFKESGQRILKVAILKNVSYSEEQVLPAGYIDLKTAEYTVRTLCNGTWLPTQDQLQEMIGGTLEDLPYRFVNWFDDNYVVGNPFTSMEQLWLAFVMWNNYKKVWNDGEWAKVRREKWRKY